MRREFRRQQQGEQPTEGHLDELLEAPPDLQVVGPLTGYRDGSRVRRWVYLGIIAGVVAAGFAGRWYMKRLEAERKTVTPHYELAAGAEDEKRPNAMVWSTGVARLGLTRQEPGVRAIVLPDRIVTLAPGCDNAQIKVDVRNGETVALKVLTGEIRQKDREPGSTP
ncbi:MAG: hypothetical protein AAF799_15860 [Myxococcota bacterium]